MKLAINLLVLTIVAALIYLLIMKPDLLINPDKPNAAADGFSRFYSNFRNSIQQGSQQSDYVLQIPDTSEQLTAQLRRRQQHITPVTTSWRGGVSRRRFQAGTTLKTALQDYAQQEQMELYWTLPRDYVVKQFFETNGNMVETVQTVALAIGPDFTKPVFGFLCPKSRALVITDLDDPFLKQQCVATGNTSQQRR